MAFFRGLRTGPCIRIFMGEKGFGQAGDMETVYRFCHACLNKTGLSLLLSGSYDGDFTNRNGQSGRKRLESEGLKGVVKG